MPPTQDTIIYRKRRRVALFVAVSLVVGFVVWLASSFGFVEISASGTTQKSTVSIDDKDVGSLEGSTSTKKLVRKGSHTVVVRSGDSSYISVVNSPGFLGSSSVNASVQPEKSRTFIGNSPGPCMVVSSSSLVTSGCGASVYDMVLHQPATVDTPTYTRKLPTSLGGYLEGLFTLNGRSYAVIKNNAEAHDQATHGLFRFQPNHTLRFERELSDLDEDVTYTVQAHKGGFVAISSDLTNVFYYSTLNSRSQDISPSPNLGDLSPYYINAEGASVVTALAEDDNTEADLDEEHTTDAASTVVQFSENTQRSYKLDRRYAKVVGCGPDYLCGLADETLSVYKTGDKAIHQYDIKGVTDVSYAGGNLLIVRGKDIIRFDVSRGGGSVDYSLGSYEFCGLTPTGTDYIVCVVGKNADRSALLLTQTGENDGIDKKLYALSEAEEIASVSAHKNIVFLSPRFNEDSSSVFDPIAVQNRAHEEVNNKIKSLISQSGINRSRYQIINPYDR